MTSFKDLFRTPFSSRFAEITWNCCSCVPHYKLHSSGTWGGHLSTEFLGPLLYQIIDDMVSKCLITVEILLQKHKFVV